jgi:Flp pilus assembly protein protease CpaA
VHFIIYYVILAVFLICLNIAAWQDYKTGEASLLLLLFSAAASLVLSGISAYAGSDKGLGQVTINVLDPLLVILPLYALHTLKKMGGTDVIIFIHITFLFGLSMFVETLLLASLTGLVAALMKWAFNPVRPKFELLRKQEVRFVPYIAFAVQSILAVDFVTASIR